MHCGWHCVLCLQCVYLGLVVVPGEDWWKNKYHCKVIYVDDAETQALLLLLVSCVSRDSARATGTGNRCYRASTAVSERKTVREKNQYYIYNSSTPAVLLLTANNARRMHSRV